jgi:hypothetical protein
VNGATGCAVGTCLTFFGIHEFARVCCQLGAAFGHSGKLVLVMCPLTHCIVYNYVVQTPFEDLKSHQRGHLTVFNHMGHFFRLKDFFSTD